MLMIEPSSFFTFWPTDKVELDEAVEVEVEVICLPEVGEEGSTGPAGAGAVVVIVDEKDDG